MRIMKSISRERMSASPGHIYTSTILEPSYEFMLANYFYPLVETNKAWILMLAEADIVRPQTASRVLEVLYGMEKQGPDALGGFDSRLEYFYSHMEHVLIERVGEDAAGEINVGRTRPEPLARMAARTRLIEVMRRLLSFRGTILELAGREAETFMPQWTHLQPAQPSTLGHYLLGVEQAVQRDWSRIIAAYKTMNQCTLGCGALAGSSYPIRRDLVAELLGFDGVVHNTIDCVSAADYALETTNSLATMMVTLSRICQDLYFWQTWELRFIEVADEFAGSSSLMPQKKNAYPMEYVRARAGRAIGEAAAASATLHNTNFQDTKDVEEEVVIPLLRLCDDVIESLRLLEGTMATLSINRERMKAMASEGFSTVTELAAVIHRSGGGLSYRTAHRIVGRAVRISTETGVDLNAALLRNAARELVGVPLDWLDDEIVNGALDPEQFVRAHKTPGGPAPEEVMNSVGASEARRLEDESRLGSIEERLRAATELLRVRCDRLIGHHLGAG